MNRDHKECTAINPNMITLAREARGLTQLKTAKKLNISQAKLSKIEAGLRPLTPELLRCMVDEFHYPESFFSLQYTILGPGSSEFFHRKRQSISTRMLNKLHAEINVRIIHIRELLNAVEIKADSIPEWQLEDGWASPSEIARALRVTWNIPPGPVQNLIKAIEDCDFKSFTSAVSEFDSESTLDHKKISMLLWIKKEIMDANFFA